MPGRCCSCGRLTDDLLTVRVGTIGGQPIVMLVCRECFGRHHWAELFVNEWASARGIVGGRGKEVVADQPVP